MSELFPNNRKISAPAMNILKKRYFDIGETSWEDVANRVVNFVLKEDNDNKEITRDMILGRYFVPNSPCLANSGKRHNGLLACFVVDFPDNIEGIYKTKLDFALIARKGGGCGTSLEKIRPEGSNVAGSTHGHAGGGVKFADTISHDMDAITQSGFRSMAIMFTQSAKHPDILKFVSAKSEEGRMSNANMSVMVDNEFMQAAEDNQSYFTEFEGKQYQEYNAGDIFNLIIEGMWRNGEPSLLFRDRINDSPYRMTDQEIFSTNP